MIQALLKNYLNDFYWCTWSHRLRMKGNRNCFDIYTHMKKNERLMLYKLATRLPKNCAIVEIGSYLGASSTFLASAAREKRGTVYCVDTWGNDAMREGKRDTYEEFVKNTCPYKDVIVPLRGDSVAIAGGFDKKIDLIFIDGDHDYNGVKRDVEAWLPKLKDHATVILHDYSWADGVKQVVEEKIRPVQVEKGHCIDHSYWTRVKPVPVENGREAGMPDIDR